MKFYARAACAPSESPEGPATLLEGSWPRSKRAPNRFALDDWLRPEHRVLDVQAQSLAARLADGVGAGRTAGDALACARLADRCALALRYYLVKLLRVAAFCAERPFVAGGAVRLRFDPRRDLDYVALLQQAAQRDGAVLHLEQAGGPPPRSESVQRGGTAWRRLAGRLANQVARRRLPPAPAFRTLLCGTPHVLGTVCDALLGRGAEVVWLNEQFVGQLARRWSLRGVAQALCDARRPHRTAQPAPLLDQPVMAYGIDLRPALQTWFDARFESHGAWLESVESQLERHLRGMAPHAVVIDEDATPLKRALLRAAHRCGAPTLVVQHGVPCVRFGFAPSAADRIAVWGESSREQLLGWGVPAERIAVCGCSIVPAASAAVRRSADDVLLLATAPPRADRPDSVAFGLTVESHAAMLRAAGEVVARHRLRLLVRLHPRTADASAVLEPLAQVPGLRYEALRGGRLYDLVRSVRCVFSCASSSGVQAAAAGAPVIQLMPPGGADLLPAAAWGLHGTARTSAEAEALFATIPCGTPTATPFAPPLAAQGAAAAERIVDEIQRLIVDRSVRSRDGERTPCLAHGRLATPLDAEVAP